jgi:hypothetical protein
VGLNPGPCWYDFYLFIFKFNFSFFSLGVFVAQMGKKIHCRKEKGM